MDLKLNLGVAWLNYFFYFDNILYKTLHLHAQNEIYLIRIPKLCVLQINKMYRIKLQGKLSSMLGKNRNYLYRIMPYLSIKIRTTIIYIVHIHHSGYTFVLVI